MVSIIDHLNHYAAFVDVGRVARGCVHRDRDARTSLITRGNATAFEKISAIRLWRIEWQPRFGQRLGQGY